LIKRKNIYNIFTITIILIGFTISNWAEYFHHHEHKNYNSCCGSSYIVELNYDIYLNQAKSDHVENECSLCKVISVSSFNYLLNNFKIDFLTNKFDFSYFQSINYTFQNILNLKNKSPPHTN